MQPIDYNSSILAALLSGINLACLGLWKKQDGGPARLSCFCRLVVFEADSFFLFKAHRRHFLTEASVRVTFSYSFLAPGSDSATSCCYKACPSDVHKQIQSSVSVIDLVLRASVATIFLSLIDWYGPGGCATRTCAVNECEQMYYWQRPLGGSKCCRKIVTVVNAMYLKGLHSKPKLNSLSFSVVDKFESITFI